MELEYFPPGITKEFFEYYASLTGKDQQIVQNQLNHIETMSIENVKKTETLKSLDKENNIWEFVIGNHRLTTTPINNVFWILHGFRKKTQKTPIMEIKKAISIKNKLYKYLKI